MKRFLANGLGTAALLLAFGCAHSNPPAAPGTNTADKFAAPSSPSESGDPQCSAPTWSYPSNNASWGGTCFTGQSQSPVALAFDPLGDNLPGTITVRSIPIPILILVNEGFTASAEITASAVSFTDGANTWQAFEVHFHSSSEHSLTWQGRGSAFDTRLEMHIKTRLQSDPSQYAVFAVLFMVPENGAETDNPTLQPIFSQLADLASNPICEKLVYPGVLDLMPIISSFGAAGSGYLTYDGSLTTPDCGEGKKWYVLSTPQWVSTAQVAQLHAFVARGMGRLSPLGNNNRAVQPLGSRKVTGFINK